VLTHKPFDDTVDIANLVEITEGLSGAQIENLLNEAMLNALRNNRQKFTYSDFDLVFNKMMVGWQPNEHEFTSNVIDSIAPVLPSMTAVAVAPLPSPSTLEIVTVGGVA
jgi:cell division protease FtsH